MVRDKNIIKPAPGKRQCNCRNKMVTKQVGPGMFQQYAMQVSLSPPPLTALAYTAPLLALRLKDRTPGEGALAANGSSTRAPHSVYHMSGS